MYHHLSLENSTAMPHNGQAWSTMPLAATATACHGRRPLFIKTSSVMPKKDLIAYKNDRFRIEPTRCSQPQVDDHKTEKHGEPESTVRPLGNFPPCLWGDRFSTFTLDTQLYEKYSKEVEVLKEEVKDMLITEGKPAEKMVLIDTLERLGVSYLFEKEIEELLERMFPNVEERSHVFEDDLFMVSLHFRVFRQHGYNLSSCVFKKFKDYNGNFKETISNDVKGLLSLYEATYLKTHGEDILDDAFCFTKARLESLKPYLSPDLAEQVTHSLYQSLQRGMPRIETRSNISFYEKDPSRDEKLLRLAKIDFNRLQMLHKEELCHFSRWWKELDLLSDAPYVRNRVVESYFSAYAIYFEPQYSLARLILSKISLFLSVLDDTYDAYGTYEELKLFTNAVQRWDINAIDQLPKYMKSVYKALLNLYEEIEREMVKQERTFVLPYLKESIKELTSCYFNETEWLNEGQVQSFNEYMVNAIITITVPPLATSAFLGMPEIATADVFQWLQTKPRLLIAASTISRILNDTTTCKTEEERHHVATGVECYMKQHGVSKPVAINELYKIIEHAWADINEEMMRPTVISRDLFVRILNLTRLHDVGYKYGDGYTKSELLKDYMIALYVDPIPI